VGGSACRENRDALVPIVIRGGRADAVVPGRRRHPGIVQEPARHQQRLLAGAQRAPFRAGATPETLGVQQGGQEQDAVLGYIEDSGMCNTNGTRGTSVKLICGRTGFSLMFCVFLLHRNRFGVSQTA
jgi:hypothetical protein